MGNLLEQSLYMEDVKYVAGLRLPWEKLKDRRILLTGASGMIGSFLVDVLMERNRQDGLNCHIYALGRSRQAAEDRFQTYWEDPRFHFLSHDISHPLEGVEEDFSYIIHLASNTHPVAYAEEPIATITTNILGTEHLLRYGADHGMERFVLASSNEIYGENRGDVEFFDESYCGYLDSNTLRAGYPESKRCAEALCQAWRREREVDVVVPRLTRSYGPTLRLTDTKALSQFLRKGINGEDIVLKSAGNQYYSYTYVADAAAGLLTVMLQGKNGEAYNIADSRSDITLKELAHMIADICHTRVIYDLPDMVEKAGYSTATKARLDGSKAKSLGWDMHYDIRTGTERTIQIMRKLP